MTAEQVQELREFFAPLFGLSGRDEAVVALCDDWLRAQKVVEAAKRAIPISVCDYPDGACEIDCGRTDDDYSGCLRIKAFEAVARYDAGGEG